MLHPPTASLRRTTSGYALASAPQKPYTPPRTPPSLKTSRSNEWPRWRFKMTRRFTRNIKRYSAWMLVFVVLVVLWRELGGSASVAGGRRKLWGGGKKGDTRHKSWHGWGGVRKVFAFGDSHTDYGFDVSKEKPRSENPIGNPTFPGLSSCYGRNYLAHLTASFNKSGILTYNLARPGSTIRNSRQIQDLDPFGQGMGLDDQIEKLFLSKYGRSAAPGASSGWKQDETLFVLYAGVDESMYEFIQRGNDTARNITDVDLNMQEYMAGLEKLYENGARNFLVIGIPGLEESPLLRNCGINKALNRFGAELTDLNGRIAFMVQMFAHGHAEDVTVFFYNNHKTSIVTRNDPKSFEETKGIQRLEGYCYFYEEKREVIEFDPACRNPLEEFYWRDPKHHTEPYHRLMAREIVELLADVRNALPFEFY